MDEIFAQFGDQAPAVQALFNAIVIPLQQEIQQLQQQVAQQNQPAPQMINQQAIAAAVAQAVIQAQPAVPPAQPAPPQQPREPKVADPPIFNGNRNELQSFIRSVRTCFTLAPSRFPVGDEVRRILFTLGFIQGGTAGIWANNTANSFLDPTVPNPFDTFEQFQNALERSFGSMDRSQKARTDLASLKMKPGDTVEEYTTTFESLAVHTGYNEAAHIEAYRSGLIPRIVEKIYGDTNGQLPVDLNAWKTKARHLDHLYHEYKALHLRGPTSANQPKTAYVHPPTKTPTATSTSTTSTLPPPDAMDVDGHRSRTVRCYNCNRFGHIARNCPEPKRNRSIRTTEIAEVVRAVLAETQPAKKEESAPQSGSDFPPSQQ